MILTIILIIFLLSSSAFFSGSETALTAVSRPLMHRYAQQDIKAAKRVLKLIDGRENLIATILLGNNLVNILSTAIATALMIKLFMAQGTAFATTMATVIMTPIVLIFSEILPKTLAVRFADKLSMIVSRPIEIIELILWPFTKILLFVTRFFSHFIAPEQDFSENLMMAEAELRGAIDLHQGDDPKDLETAEQEKIMMRSVLDLDDVTVGEIMIHRRQLEMIDADTPTREIIATILEGAHTRLPVYKDSPDNVIGLLHTRDVLREVYLSYNEKREAQPLSVMTKAWFVPETTSALDQLQSFRERREHFALVIDEYGDLQGIVTLEDILEEIVGEISDEHDDESDGMIEQPDGSWLVAGETTIRDLNRQLGLMIPDDEFTTVAGLLLYTTKRIPDKNQVFMIHGCRFEVIERQRHRITQLRVVPPSQ
ncbi:MAG: HlyC/CorC family transporter [Alphaproteobacteria bacterium]